jgi:hypothetical protein
MTTAEKVSEIMGDDGQRWEIEDQAGNVRNLQDICDEYDGQTEYSAREYDDDNNLFYVAGHQGGHLAGDPVRHVFPDGSAIVEAGDAWDIEGDQPFSWEGDK